MTTALATREIPIKKTQGIDVRLFAEAAEIGAIIQSVLPPRCSVQGRWYHRKDGSIRIAVAYLTPTPTAEVAKLLSGEAEVIHTEDIPMELRVDERVVRRIRQALKGRVEFEPIMADRRRYKGRTPSGIAVTLNTHICNGKGMKVKAKSNIGYYLSCTT